MNPLRTAWTSLKLLCLMAYVVSLAHPAQAQTVNTQVTLSCNDGHSVIFDVDQITLTSLPDAQAINTSGTGTSCTLTTAAIDPQAKLPSGRFTTTTLQIKRSRRGTHRTHCRQQLLTEVRPGSSISGPTSTPRCSPPRTGAGQATSPRRR